MDVAPRVVVAHQSSFPALVDTPLRCDEERARLARMRTERARTHFLVGRALAYALADDAGLPPTVTISYDDWGRPVFAEHRDLAVSISHTDHWVAAAIAPDRRLGIDVQSPLAHSAYSESVLERFLPAG